MLVYVNICKLNIKSISSVTLAVNKMVYISSCCGCVGLEKGCTITSVLQIIAGGIALIYKSCLAATLKKDIIWDDDPNWTFYKVTVAAAVTSALHVMFGFVLYIGIKKKHTKSMASWICFMLLALTASLVFLVMMLVQSIEAVAAVGEIMTKLIFGIVVMSIEAYLVAVVYSFYQMVKSDNSMNEYK